MQRATRSRTYWGDPETKLPRQIDIEYRSVDAENGGQAGTITNIVFDAHMDESLFSTDPPKGYTVSKGGYVSFEKAPD